MSQSEKLCAICGEAPSDEGTVASLHVRINTLENRVEQLGRALEELNQGTAKGDVQPVTMKPCPNPDCASPDPQIGFSEAGAWVACSWCGLQGPHLIDEDEVTSASAQLAIAAWNKLPRNA